MKTQISEDIHVNGNGSAATEATVGPVAAGSSPCRSVLLIDDEARILNALYRLLHESYDVERTESPEEALEMLANREFALIISDQRMPDMEGSELCARASQISPETKRVILTGYSDMKAAIDAINRGSVYRFMLKPWRDDEMSALVEEAVRHYNLSTENERLNELTARQNVELQRLNKQLEGFNEKLQEKVFERTIEVTKLNDKVTNYFRGSIDLLSRLSGMHSEVLGNHGRRVAELSMKIGRAHGLSEKQLNDLEIAAALHDIGKIGMDPKVVATMNGEGSDHDQGVLRSHPVEGAALVARIPGLDEVATMVRHHHEEFGGSGYPHGLQGEAIPIGARIIAVADAFDNFLNMRSRYTDAKVSTALKYVQAQSATHFDPKLVRILEELFQSEQIEIPESNEVEISLRELRTGMVLSRDLVTTSGKTLLQGGTMVTGARLPDLFERASSDPVAEGPYVYRHWPPKKG